MVEGLGRLVYMRSNRSELVHELLEFWMLCNDGMQFVDTMGDASIPKNLECWQCRSVVVGLLTELEQATCLDHFNSTVRGSREDVDASPQIGQLLCHHVRFRCTRPFLELAMYRAQPELLVDESIFQSHVRIT